MCGGDFDTATFKTLGGSAAQARHCMQCGGFWFERPLDEPLAPFSVSQYDAAAPNYSLKQIDLVCPNDQSLLSEVDDPDQPAGTQFWRCSDCDGCFYPRGQLAHVTNWQATTAEAKTPIVSRSRSALAVLLVVFGAVVFNLTVQKLGTLEAFGEQVLPSSGPNLLTLSLLALTYLAGTILAVLGRRIAVVIMGWGVITICLVGFSVVIFGP